MKQNNNITRDELSQVKYGDLLKKFTELGIPEVWKAGTKKIKMIESAIEKLKIKDSLEQLGLNEIEVSQELEVIVKNKIEAKELEVETQVKQQEIKEKQEAKQLAKQQFSKEQIQNQIDTIGKNLINGIPSHRVILLKKRDMLLDLISKM
tara:strand:+ start:923 stop:1372 length:450 start_codon:yes stop_codon:yes gene_type:complete